MIQRILPQTPDADPIANIQLTESYFRRVFGQLRGEKQGGTLTAIEVLFAMDYIKQQTQLSGYKHFLGNNMWVTPQEVLRRGEKVNLYSIPYTDGNRVVGISYEYGRDKIPFTLDMQSGQVLTAPEFDSEDLIGGYLGE